MHFIRSFFKRILNDLKLKKLIPLKLLFFVHASTLFVLYPYLTIHMRELGINVEETAIMSAVTPVVSIVMPPLAGMLADKIGNFRLLLALSSTLGGVSALLLLAVPVGRLTITFPPAVELLTTCRDGLQLQHMNDYPCEPLHPYPYDVNLTIVSCGFVCELPEGLPMEEVNMIMHSLSYDIQIRSSSDTHRLVYRHTVSGLLHHTMAPKKDQSTTRIMTNDVYFNTSIAKISDQEVFFPAPRLYQMACTHNSSEAMCILGGEQIFDDISESKTEESYKVRVANEEKKRLLNIVGLYAGNSTEVEENYQCKDYFNVFEGESVKVHVTSMQLSRCSAACAGTVPRKTLCENKVQHVEVDPAFTFWAYLAVRVFIGIIGGTAFAMFEGAVIAIVREQRADYGLQRVYGSIGGMISSPLSGLLIDYVSRGKGYTDFRPAFYLYAVLKVASGVLMLSIDLEFKQPAQNLLEDVISVFRNIEIVALFIACFIMGTAWGYIESFLFWLLQDLGASRSLMGVTITVGGVAGLPLLVLSGPIIRRLGHANVLFIGFVFYAIRLLGYSLIYNPWLCLIFEALESVTSSLSFTAAVTYAARLSSTTTDTSVQGLLGGLYYGVGRGAGSLIGGYLMKYFGTRPTYQIFAAATLLTGFIYFLFNKFYIGKRAVGDENDLCKKKPVADIEGREPCNVEAEKVNSNTDAVKLEGDKLESCAADDKTKATDLTQIIKVTTDNIDGGSDSGVDNPAFNDTESTIELKKEDSKANGQC
ncbi:unnamed protein product [Chilo suppressalis]|uniref:Major facilitator superfamily associated domain-containing protein n=1 Tax=Chilo suppressalis TaxID=168631 RepID=A0ABN8BF96_CHISP|nr:unnamed protein product [Chilo suppressalis]